MKFLLLILLVIPSLAHAATAKKKLGCTALTWDAQGTNFQQTTFSAQLTATPPEKFFSYNYSEKPSFETKNGRFEITVEALLPWKDHSVNDTIVILVRDKTDDPKNTSGAGSLNVGNWIDVKVDQQVIMLVRKDASMNVSCHLR